MQRTLTGHAWRIALVAAWAGTALAGNAEWPGWQGPNRDGKSPDTGLLKAWPAEGPKLLWKQSGLGAGFSSATVAGGRVYVTGDVDGALKIHVFDMDGKLVKSVTHGPAWTKSYPGGRGTVTVHDGRCYLLSGDGKLSCYAVSDLAELWTKPMSAFGGSPHGWGYAESVLIAGGNVVVAPGGKQCVVALNPATGETVWTSPGNGAPAHYGSAIEVADRGMAMIVAGNGGGIFAVSPRDGAVLWQNPFSANNTANCPTPAYADGHVFWANGYGRGAICLRVKPQDGGVAAEQAWTGKALDCHHGGYIIHNGHIYGNHGGGWRCLDLKTGTVKWENPGVGKGSVCYADGMLYLFGESGGKVGLAAATPDGFTMNGQFAVAGTGNSWAHPVVIGGRLYLRYGDNLYCYDVRAAANAP